MTSFIKAFPLFPMNWRIFLLCQFSRSEVYQSCCLALPRLYDGSKKNDTDPDSVHDSGAHLGKALSLEILPFRF